MSSPPSRTLSPYDRQRKDRRQSQHRQCDFGRDHTSTLLHEQALDEAAVETSRLRRLLAEKDDELLGYHSELGKAKEDLSKAEKRFEEAKAIFKVAQEEEKEHEREVTSLVKERDDAQTALVKWKEALNRANENTKTTKALLETVTSERETLRSTLQKRPREEDLTRLEGENKKLLRESKDVRKRVSEIVGPEWNSEKPEEALERIGNELKTTREARDLYSAKVTELESQLAETRRARIVPVFTPEPESDLSALTDLHPALAKQKNPTAKQLANSLVEAITFDLNDIWSHLPNQQEEALVTPSTRRIDIILNRLKEAVKKDANLKLAPELSQAKARIQDLNKELASAVQAYSAKDKQFKTVQNRNKQLRDQINGWKLLLGIEDEEATEEIEAYVKRLRDQADTKPWIDILTRHNLLPRHNVSELRKQYDSIVTTFVKQQEEVASLPTVTTTDTALVEELQETREAVATLLQWLRSLRS